jgi:Fuc2NAc and GlcNAc transferase
VVLLGLFVVDATLTLVVRFSRGEAWYRPHRTHAYQQLARQWASHRRVTVTALVVNICWLLPWAVLAWRFPMQGWWLMLVALLPLVWAAAAIGGGGGSIERVAERDQ